MSAARAGLVFAAGSVLALGLRHGAADHLLHIPLSLGVPEGDLLHGAAAAHPTLWWWLIGGLGSGSMAAHVAVLVAVGAALWRLAGDLGVQRWWVLAILMVGQPALGGVDTTDSLLLPRGAALPLELFAWALFVQRRRRWAFALLGLAVCVHAPSAVGLSGALIAVHLGRRGSPWDLLALATAAPVVVPALLAGGPLWMDTEWKSIVSLRLGHHVDAATWAPTVWWRKAAWLGIVGLAWRQLAPPLKDAVLALSAVTSLGAVAWWTGLALPIQLELWEVDRLGTIACALAASTLLAAPRAWPAGLLLVAGQPVPAALWLGGGQVLRIEDSPTRILNPQYLTPLCGLVLAWVALHPPDGRSPAAWGAATAPELEVPAGAVVVVPPVGFDGLRLQGVGLYGTWKDGGEGLFDRARAREWKRRMEAISGPLPTLERDRFRGDRQAKLRDALQQGYAPGGELAPATHLIQPDGGTLVRLTPADEGGTIAP